MHCKLVEICFPITITCVGDFVPIKLMGYSISLPCFYIVDITLKQVLKDDNFKIRYKVFLIINRAFNQN